MRAAEKREGRTPLLVRGEGRRARAKGPLLVPREQNPPNACGGRTLRGARCASGNYEEPPGEGPAPDPSPHRAVEGGGEEAWLRARHHREPHPPGPPAVRPGGTGRGR